MKSIVEIADQYHEFEKGDDGYVMWHPCSIISGGMTSKQLRELADELDRRNEKWDKEVNDYFDKQKE